MKHLLNELKIIIIIINSTAVASQSGRGKRNLNLIVTLSFDMSKTDMPPLCQ